MKPKNSKINQQSGFTLIELLVVLSIMVVVSMLVILDFNRQKPARSITLAKNETITNIRKVQGYMLSSKNIDGNIPARYYIVQFDLNNPTIYTVQAIDKDYGFHDNIEKIELPGSVAFSSFSGGGLSNTDKCFQLLISAPFGTMYVRGSSICSGSDVISVVQDPVSVAKLSQASVSLVFKDSSSVQISPLTGQVYPK